MLSDTFSRQELTPIKIETHPCPTYRSTGQDSCRRSDRVIVAEHITFNSIFKMDLTFITDFLQSMFSYISSSTLLIPLIPSIQLSR
jgi:hypothetical protein